MPSKQNKTKKTKATPAEQVAAFRAVSDQLAEAGPRLEHLLSEPWPDWFTHVVLRFARIVMPEMLDAAKERDWERMAGHIAGSEALLRDALLECNGLEEIRKLEHPIWKTMGDELEEFAGPEGERIKKTMQAATDLPTGHAGTFFSAYGKAIADEAPVDMFERWASSTTATICFSLIVLRPFIEKRHFKNISEVIAMSIRWREAAGDQTFKNLEVRGSYEAQFRKICSQAKLKLARRGRPPGK